MGAQGGPVGVILAGGRGRRMGGAKALVALHGVPLIAYPLAALRAVTAEVAIVVKPDTRLPDLPGLTVWIEPSSPQHPLAGIVYALEMAGDRPVLVCASDLPFVTAELLGRVAAARATAGRTDTAAAVCAHAGAMQPLLACYWPAAEPRLRAGLDELRPLRAVVAELRPVIIEVDAEALFNVNAPEDVLTAAAILDRRRAVDGGRPAPAPDR